MNRTQHDSDDSDLTPGLGSEENSERCRDGKYGAAAPEKTDSGDFAVHATPGVNHALALEHFRAIAIARAIGLSKRQILRRAAEENWPKRTRGNRLEFLPPADITAVLLSPLTKPPVKRPTRVEFTDLIAADDVRKKHLKRESSIAREGGQREKVLTRHDALQFYRQQISDGATITAAVIATVAAFPNCSARSLRRWDEQESANGLNGLVEQKLGIVGKKNCLHSLSDDELREFTNHGKALALEHGAKGRQNIARAARILSAEPTLPASLREVIHGGHASKSYVNPAVRTALKIAPQTIALAQGPRHARLSSRWTPGDYSDVKAGDIYTADDMTSNIIAWCEWPNPLGFRMGQPQILAVLDVGSLAWLNFRCIMRVSGAYTTDDIAGVFGDVFDSPGLPKLGLLLEGGLWQSNKVQGHRTGLSDDDRLGGLASLGLKVWRAYDPRHKAVIETGFNQLQFKMDACPGYIGREQRKDQQERVEHYRKLCAVGKRHPREFFPHVSELADHVAASMQDLNHERSDGIVLRGRSPEEKMNEDKPEFRVIPPSSQWLYRSSMNVEKVTRNGIRICQGSGARQMVYYYDAPEWLGKWEKQKVAVYWNEGNPDADAIVLSIFPKRQFLGVAKRVQPISRFTATDDQLATERQRKKAAANYSRSELRSIKPYFMRRKKIVQSDAKAVEIGRHIAEASDRAQDREKVLREIKKTPRDLLTRTHPDLI